MLFSDAARLFDDPHRLTFLVAVYLVGGPIWGIVHWFLFVVHRRNLYLAMRRDFSEKAMLDGDDRKQFERELRQYADYSFTFDGNLYHPFCRGGSGGGPLEIIPLARHNAVRITAWMTYWPLSLLGWLLRDALRWVFTDLLWSFWRWVQCQFAAIFDGISQSVFGDVAKEMKKEDGE